MHTGTPSANGLEAEMFSPLFLKAQPDRVLISCSDKFIRIPTELFYTVPTHCFFFVPIIILHLHIC